jgi:archaellum component FlaC
MTIDERLDRLTDRHEALTESVEMLRDRTTEIARSVEQLTASINKLVEVTNRDAVDIRALARIAESRDRRLSDIEGRRP